MANTTTLVKPLFEHARKVPFNIAPAQGARLASEMFRKKGWVFLNEAEIGQGSDHPPAFNRFREASALFQGLGFRSPALENATYLFKVVFDPEAVLSVITDLDVPMFTIDEGDWPRRTQSETPSGVDAGGVFALMD